MFRLFLTGILVLCLTACGDPSSGDNNGGGTNNASDNSASNGSTDQSSNNGMDEEVPEGALTYWADIRPIMDAHCVSCHTSDSGVAPYDWTDPEQAKNLAELIRGSVESGQMPPWYPETDECAPLKGDLQLNAEQIAAFGQWVDDGKYIGDEDDYEPGEPIPADINADRLVEDERITLTPDEPYPVPTSVSDDFRCFTIDPGFETTRWMSGFEVAVDNASVLHHMLIFSVGNSEENAQELAALEAEDPEPGFDCFGTPGVDEMALVGAWAPGGGRTGFPNNTGVKMEPGAKIVLQMHYNLAEGSGEDQSGVHIWVRPEDERIPGEAQLALPGNLPFEIPPGVNGLDVPDEECDIVYSIPDGATPPDYGISEEEAEQNPNLVGQNGCVIQELYYELDLPTRIWAVGPHMHLKGEQIKIEILPWEEGETASRPVEEEGACLNDLPTWDFNWQRLYWLQEPVQAPARGVVRLTCRYDNSDEGSPIALGDGSGDEMCLGLFYLSL